MGIRMRRPSHSTKHGRRVQTHWILGLWVGVGCKDIVKGYKSPLRVCGGSVIPATIDPHDGRVVASGVSCLDS